MRKPICVIAGAGPGMGVSLAKRFARAGYTIALISRSAPQLAAELQPKHPDVHGFAADLSNTDAIATVFQQIQTQLGTVSVLIYNAAMVVSGFASELNPATVLEHFRVNVLGAILCVEKVVASMKEQRTGTILFTGGGLSIDPNPEYASLALSKAALRNYALSLHRELKGHGVRVATVTVAGYIHPEDGFDPDKIADVYWRLHEEDAEADFEVLYDQAYANQQAKA